MGTTIPLKFIKADAAPAVWEPNAVYFIKNNSFAESYVTAADGTPEEIGNTEMIQQVVDAMGLGGDIPTKVSELENDIGYITAGSVNLLTNKSGNISQWTNDANYLTLPGLSNSNFGTASVGLNLDGQGTILSTGQKGYVRVPFNGTITGWSIISDVIGSAVFDVWKSAGYPTAANTITGSAKPTLTGATTAQSSTLTGWTIAVTAGDVIGWNLDSAAVITRAILQLTIVKT